MGYIYGRLTLNLRSPGPSHLRAGLVIRQVDGPNSYSMEFTAADEPEVIAVPPGSYALQSIAYATYNYGSHGQKPLVGDGMTRAFTVEAGKAYYVGDYAMDVAAALAFPAIVQHSWHLDGVHDGYAETTAELKTRFPNLSRIETVRALPAYRVEEQDQQ